MHVCVWNIWKDVKLPLWFCFNCMGTFFFNLDLNQQGHTASMTYHVQRSYSYGLGWDVWPDKPDVPAIFRFFDFTLHGRRLSLEPHQIYLFALHCCRNLVFCLSFISIFGQNWAPEPRFGSQHENGYCFILRLSDDALIISWTIAWLVYTFGLGLSVFVSLMLLCDYLDHIPLHASTSATFLSILSDDIPGRTSKRSLFSPSRY